MDGATPVGGSRIKALKMLGVVGGLFLEQKLSKLSIVRYTIAIVIAVSFSPSIHSASLSHH